VLLLFHKKLYGATPPLTVIFTEPSSLPQEAFRELTTEAINEETLSTPNEAPAVQPLASVTVTAYVPAVKLFKEAALPPLFQL
jgi:hypothetical protein